MTRNELLFRLRALELRLLSPNVDEFVRTQDEPTQARFFSLMLDLRIIITRLTTVGLAEIAAKLDDLSDELQAGIDSLQNEIDQQQKTIDLINAFSSVVGYAARIVSLGL